MQRKKIYVDSCVLMAAFKAKEPAVSDAALELLSDPAIERLYSRITELEVLPKSIYNKFNEEADFYRTFFEASTFVPCTEQDVDRALSLGIDNGLGAGDALHVACAISAQADELVTSEGKTKLPSAPRPGVPIRTLRPRGA
jgi:predicted nucleic acid-binding protein